MEFNLEELSVLWAAVRRWNLEDKRDLELGMFICEEKTARRRIEVQNKLLERLNEPISEFMREELAKDLGNAT